MKNTKQSPRPDVSEHLLSVSMTEIQRAFTEWDRRFREEPERFDSEATHLLKGTPETYGEACAPYFLQIVEEVKTGKIA